MRTASSTASKHWAGVAAATTGRGDSPWRPWIAIRRSAASVFVGIPVDGPARCQSITRSGSSRATARPIVSCFRSMPGPLEAVTPRWPPNEAPRAMLAAAISSSACTVRTPNRLWRESSCRSSEAGGGGGGGPEQGGGGAGAAPPPPPRPPPEPGRPRGGGGGVRGAGGGGGGGGASAPRGGPPPAPPPPPPPRL